LSSKTAGDFDTRSSEKLATSSSVDRKVVESSRPQPSRAR
jgi:hypothetical protein